MKYIALIAILATLVNGKTIECNRTITVKFKAGKKTYKVVIPKSVIEKEGFCHEPFKLKINRDKETRG